MNDKSEWIEVGELQEGFAPNSNILAPVGDLAGKTLTLHDSHGAVTRYHFESPDELSWTALADSAGGRPHHTEYRATSLRAGIYFVDGIDPSGRAKSLSLVLDLDQGIYTAVTGRLPTASETKRDLHSRVQAADPLTGVLATFAHGSIDTPCSAATPRHTPTDELVGKRVQYIYSDTEAYEHIYLNERLYTWQCLKGLEKGLADTDSCHHFKIAEALYLFVWREKIIPTLGVVMVDLGRMKTTGKIFGYLDNAFDKLSNFAVGAYAKMLNQTQYSI
jgi:hypothetical protein